MLLDVEASQPNVPYKLEESQVEVEVALRRTIQI